MNQRIERFKNHIRKNKGIYIAAGIGLAVGAVTVFLVMNHRQDVLTISGRGNNIINKAKNVTIVSTYLERRGHPGNIIKCDQTGELFASQNRAAELLGLNPARLSEHLTGKNPNVNGLTFTKLGEAG